VEPIRPIGPRPDLEPVRPVVLSPRERDEQRREREERRREREERRERAGRDPQDPPAEADPPRLDVRA
jgi:hypothetical protein